MKKIKKYFRIVGTDRITDGIKLHGVVSLSARAEMAFHLISSFGSVAGKSAIGNPEGMVLQSPDELVNRCFQIADLFYE